MMTSDLMSRLRPGLLSRNCLSPPASPSLQTLHRDTWAGDSGTWATCKANKRKYYMILNTKKMICYFFEAEFLAFPALEETCSW